MPGSGTLTVSGTFAGLPLGSEAVSFTLTNTNAVGAISVLNVTTTPTAIVIPSSSAALGTVGTPTVMLLFPATSNGLGNALRISGAAGETAGCVLGSQTPSILTLSSLFLASNQFLFASSSTVPVQVVFL